MSFYLCGRLGEGSYPPEPVLLEDLSKAPPGCKKIKNIYVDENTKTAVEYKDEPEE